MLFVMLELLLYGLWINWFRIPIITNTVSVRAEYLTHHVMCSLVKE